MKEIKNYASVIFDCDGVILNSNKVVSESFYKAVLEYGEDSAEDLKIFNQVNGGISRYKKLDHFFKNILKLKNFEDKLDNALIKFSKESINGRLNCEVDASFLDYGFLAHQKKMVISGANELELKKIFKKRGIDSFFSHGIFGSPDSKKDILEREIKNNNITFPAIYLGDSKYDYEVSKEFNLDFIFISQWTEFSDWNIYQKQEGFKSFHSLEQLFSYR